MTDEATSSGNNSLDYMETKLNSTSIPNKENFVVIEDRLSFLPNDVAHRILSLLSIGEIGMLSLTSKRCEKLCLTVPSLFISDHSLSFPNGFMDFLVHFMRSRRGAKLTKLSILCRRRKLKYNEIFRFVWLLNHAMECQVNDIDIDLSLESETGLVFVMPQDVLCCESLISLKIALTYNDGFMSRLDGALEFPSPHGFAYLRSLHLTSVRIDSDSFGEQISYVCKFLEKLTLEYLYAMQKFKISSQSLLELTIFYCSIEHLDISASSLQTIDLSFGKIKTSMNVYAPNLLCFYWHDLNLCENLNFVENPSLLHTLDLRLEKNHPRRIKLDNLLPIIAQVSYLIINRCTIEALYEDRDLPLIFNNLLKLDLEQLDLELLYSSWTAPLVQNISRFLHGLPCSLKKLHMVPFPLKTPHIEDHTYETKFWELQNLRLVQGLEEFEVNLFGRKYEESLLEYLLENAKKLKKITISFKGSMASTIVCKLMAAAVARGASFCVKGQKRMVLELK